MAVVEERMVSPGPGFADSIVPVQPVPSPSPAPILGSKY